MASFNKFECFAGDVGLKVHNLNTDTISVFLSNSAPNASTHTAYDGTTGTTGPAEITAENGYSAGGEDITNAYSESGGTGTLTGTDVVFTATGSVGPFQYAVIYNSTSAGNELIGWWDYGSAVTLADGETFTVDFGASILTIT